MGRGKEKAVLTAGNGQWRYQRHGLSGSRWSLSVAEVEEGDRYRCEEVKQSR